MRSISGRRSACVRAFAAGCATMLALAGAARAQENEGTRAITLDEAERLALENNERIVLARDSVMRAEVRVTGARAGLLPIVALSGSYTRNLERNVFFAPPPLGRVEIGNENEYQLALNGSQPLFLGFAGISGYRLARTGAESARLGLEEATQDVVQNVREAYLAAVLARRIVAVQTEAVAQAESSLAQVRRRFEVGTVSRFDLLRAQVQLSTTRPGLTNATSNRDLADARLRLALGLDPGKNVRPADTLSVFQSRWAGAPLDSLIAIAWARRPDIRQIAYFREMAGYGVNLARSSYYPSLALFGRSIWQASRNEVLVGPDDFSRSVAAGVQVSWSLWNSWRTSAAVQEARIGVRQTGTVNELLRNVVALEVEAAYRQLAQAGVNLATGEETVGQAAEALRLARVIFDAGSGTQLDVINAQLALTQARTQYATALYEYHVAHLRVEKALGLVETGT